MRFKNYLFFGLIFIAMVALSAFAHYKNKQRLVNNIEIDFENSQAKFLSLALVNKLLIQKKGELPWEGKDSLDLNMLETFLEHNPYILNAEVFNLPKGILGVKIQERKSLVRIQGKTHYYLDKSGFKFPISKVHKPMVPIFIGELEEQQKNDLLTFLNVCNQDPFFMRELNTIYHKSNSFFIGLKSYDFDIEIGSLNDVNDKLLKLKVFCAYQDNNKLDKKYRLINLKFKNQIVGS